MKKKNVFMKIILVIVGAFLLLLLVEIIFDWDGAVESFKEGYNEASATRIEVTK